MHFTRLPHLINDGRNQHTDNLLPDGQVLLAGGSQNAEFLDCAEIFDPVTNSFTFTDNLAPGEKKSFRDPASG